MSKPIKGSPASALFSTTWGFFIGFAAVVLFSPLTNALGLTPAEKGLLLSISSLTGSLFRIPFATWVDTTGGRKPFTILLVIALIGMAGIWLLLGNDIEVIKQYFWLLLIFGGMAGCGIATFSVGIGQTSYWFPKAKQGWANGIFAGIGNLAPGIFVYIINTFLIERDEAGQVILASVRTVYLEWVIFLAVGLFIYLLTTNNAWYFQYKAQGLSAKEAREKAMQEGQELFPKASVVESLIGAAKVPHTWILVCVYFLSFGGFLALTNWFSLLFGEYHRVSIGTAALLTSIYSIGASLVRASSGKLTDQFSSRILLLIMLGITGVGAALIAITRGYSTHVAGLLCMMIGMGVMNAAVFKLLPQYVPHAVGGAAGLIGGLGAVGGFVLPNVLSQFLSSESTANDLGYRTGFWIFVVLALVNFILVVAMSRLRLKGE